MFQFIVNPCAAFHLEDNPHVEILIMRAADLLQRFSDSDVVRMLVDEGARLEEAVNATRAGAIIFADRLAAFEQSGRAGED